jgi:two-component system, NtrC family, nitrogen regulation sensor histidine kinase NtrY
MLKNRFGSLIIAIILLLLGIFIPLFNKFDLNEAAKTAQNRLFLKIEEAQALKMAYLQKKDNKKIIDAYNEQFIGIFALKNDSLAFWNTSQIPITPEKLEGLQKEGVTHLRNGWYYFNALDAKHENEKVISLIFLKPDYDLQNNYLKNEFCEWLQLPEEIQLDTTLTNKEEGVYSSTKQFLFQLKSSTVLFANKTMQDISFYVLVSGFILLLFFLIKQTASKSFWIFATSWLALFLVYSLCLYWRLPEYLYSLELFNIRRFANADSFLNAYLGQILLNGLLILAFSVAWYKHLKLATKTVNYLHALITFVCIAFVVTWLNQLLKSLITNSTLSFDFLNLFNTNWLSYFGIAALVLINLSLCVFIISFYEVVKTKWIFILAVFVLVGIVFWQQTHFNIQTYWGAGLLIILIALQYFKIPVNALSVGYVILYLSICNSTILSRYIDANDAKNLEVLSFQLTERQDPLLESEFASLPNQIQKDKNLQNLFSILPLSETETPTLIKQKYFSGYFEHYNVEVALFDKNCNPLLPNANAVYSNEGFFTDQITYFSQTPIDSNLFFIDKYKQTARYIARINLLEYKLFVLMEPKQFEEIGSFPDLLLDQSQQKQAKLKAFSYAVYRNNQLSNRFGNFSYPYLKPDSTALQNESLYAHNVYQTDADTEVIISSPKKNWSYLFTYNSYVFLFFSILTFLIYVVYSLVFKPINVGISLTQRIQFIIILLLLLAIGSIAISSTQLIKNQFAGDNTSLLQEKSQSVVNDVMPLIQADNVLREEQKDVINLTLKRNARLFSCDVSLFDNKGVLFTSSQPRLYELGLASQLANPLALQSLNTNNTANFCAGDKAGSLQFLSLYTPLYNSQNKLLGYLNLPYFAKQSELVSRLSSIISTLINLYVILFVLSILSALVLSGYITKPLRLIKQQIANISLSKRNEPIYWQSNDEIGKLVTEYNGMISKLEESANLLAKSERETAWREMAKQVAHEIKNPLTPMKLNLQYLQHVIHSNPADFKEKFERASTSIIEQIDTLANIATEFSHFAKLPSAKIESIDLMEILPLSIETFKTEPNVQFQNSILEKHLVVKADKEQVLRIFNNIIKNAIQACSENTSAEIKLSYYNESNKTIIVIADNGCGISEDLRSKLFTPNFTTKNTGSGLGLAMVKNSMESFGGKVWYESIENNGTQFYLQFNAVE